MILTLICVVIGGWVLFMGWKFYRAMDWEEPAEPSPDFGAFRKREAELLHIQEVLQEARDQGKVSARWLEEYDRFCEREIAAMKKEQEDWDKARHHPN